ncbi:MAG: hypothetical protein GWP70_00060 [Proteobacteria bacterium]|nr:hypothetical protein [Pseudomonadota bacterium]
MTEKEPPLLHIGRLEQHLSALQEQIQQLWVEVEELSAPELVAQLAGPEAALELGRALQAEILRLQNELDQTETDLLREKIRLKPVDPSSAGG